MDDDGCRIRMPGGVEVEAAVAHYCETLTDASSPASLAQDNILMGSYNMKHETVVYEPCDPINIWGPCIRNTCPKECDNSGYRDSGEYVLKII